VNWLPESLSWYALEMLLGVMAFSVLGSVLAFKLVPGPSTVRRQAGIARLILAGQFLVATGWGVFVGCLEGWHGGLHPYIPLASLLEAWAAGSTVATLSLLIGLRGARNIRNAALAGSLLSSGMSCMAFLGMSGLVAPATVAYDLPGILLGMAGGSALAGLAIWLLRDGIVRSRRWLAAPLIAGTIILITLVSFASILSFSDWSAEIDTPGSIVFQPIIVVFVSELMVTTLLGSVGATIDHRAAAHVAGENERLRELTESTFEALVIHRNGCVLDANSAFCRLIGRPISEVNGKQLAEFLPAALLRTAASGLADAPQEIDITAGGGEGLRIEVLSRDMAYGGGRAVVTALRDITERRRAEDQIRFLAHHDVLTGLSNRSQLLDVIARELDRCRPSGGMFAVLCLDLDRFKAVNDTYGHQTGDRLLQLVAERLLANIRAGDAAARVGGDEFIVLLSGVGHADTIGQLARRLIEALSNPYDLGGFEARIGASIGIAIGPHDGVSADALFSNADIALYQAKTNGRGGYCFFEAGMDRAAQERRVLEQALRKAVAGTAFHVVYQPQYSISTDHVVALEALLRWQHPDRGTIAPADFIPVAESTGLIVPLGRWVMATACHAAAGWPTNCRVAVNVSPRQFMGEDFVALVIAVLAEAGLAPDRLELEVTESLMMHDPDAALGRLRRLKAMGVHIALDDFGTGFSSLSYLQRFPFDTVKIDRSFVRDLTDSQDAQAIVSTIIAMGHRLRLQVIAEGVETAAQLDMLREQGCDLVQGFLMSRPLAADEVAPLLAGHDVQPVVELLRLG
jgi:diguanylate cyclase (GGDEF)-like protein/PAS domain S-box-containing protein